jgi:hypothetical protein
MDEAWVISAIQFSDKEELLSQMAATKQINNVREWWYLLGVQHEDF